MINKQRIKCKAILGLPLTARERAIYLLLIATEQEMKEFLDKEKELCKLRLCGKKSIRYGKFR